MPLPPTTRAALAGLLLLLPAASAAKSPPDLTRFVDPFIGTDDSDSPRPVPGGAGGSCYPGASVPFGMVQLSPDTPKASPSGYRFSDTVIQGFSLTHFNGAGCPNKSRWTESPIARLLGPVTESRPPMVSDGGTGCLA